MYKRTESVTLTGKQMNQLLTLAGANSLECEVQAELVINERLYLRKIVNLKRQLATAQRLHHEEQRKTAQTSALLIQAKQKTSELLSLLTEQSTQTYRSLSCQ